MQAFSQPKSCLFLPHLKPSSKRLGSQNKSYFLLERSKSNKSGIYYPEQIYERLSLAEPFKKHMKQKKQNKSALMKEDKTSLIDQKSYDGRDVSEELAGFERHQLEEEIKNLRLQVSYYKRSNAT